MPFHFSICLPAIAIDYSILFRHYFHCFSIIDYFITDDIADAIDTPLFSLRHYAIFH
jgi:hypothetical protein